MEYNRIEAVNYARRWAYLRNPNYADFSEMGGDCTNFISQCVYAGSSVMNYSSKASGWYYINLNNRSYSWSGVEPFYSFVTRKEKTPGIYGVLENLNKAKIGDVIQLSFDGNIYGHSLLVVETGVIPNETNILIATHTFDTYARPLSSYNYKKHRLISFKKVYTT